MTREQFIKKWLGNPTKTYIEVHRDEMRDDLDLLINNYLRPEILEMTESPTLTNIIGEPFKLKCDKKPCEVKMTGDNKQQTVYNCKKCGVFEHHEFKEKQK